MARIRNDRNHSCRRTQKLVSRTEHALAATETPLRYD